MNVNEGFPEDFIEIGGSGDWHVYPSDTVSLRGLGAHMGDVQIVCMSPELAADLERGGYTSRGQLAKAATDMARSVADTAKPGESGGYLYAAKFGAAKVWIELIDADTASIYYPHER